MELYSTAQVLHPPPISTPSISVQPTIPNQLDAQRSIATAQPSTPSSHVYGIKLPPHIDAQCVLNAEQRYHIPAVTLLAILKVESGGNLGAVRKNSNGTFDIGPAQLNTGAWARYFHSQYGISAYTMTYDMCACITLLGYATRTLINRAKGDFWRGIGNYHSATPDKHYRYMQLVATAQTALLNNRAF